jgi:hypothetical protein
LFGFETPISGWYFNPNPKSGLDKNLSTQSLKAVLFLLKFSTGYEYLCSEKWLTVGAKCPAQPQVGAFNGFPHIHRHYYEY